MYMYMRAESALAALAQQLEKFFNAPQRRELAEIISTAIPAIYYAVVPLSRVQPRTMYQTSEIIRVI